MTDERWEEIKQMVSKNFGILEEQKIELAEEHGGGTKEEVVFNGPLGKMKLDYLVKPLVLGKKTHYSKRMGATAKVDYIKSDTEKTRTLLAYKWDQAAENWLELDSAMFNEISNF